MRDTKNGYPQLVKLDQCVQRPMKIGLYKRNPASLMNCSTEQKSLLTQLCPMCSRVHMGHIGVEKVLLLYLR